MALRVVVIGLGLMGFSMARNVARSGFPTTVYDVRSEVAAGVGGATAAGTVADLGRACDVVLLSLPGPAEVEVVCLGEGGLSGTLPKGAVILDLSTNSRAVVMKIAAALAGSGIDFLDASVSGGLWGAADGTLAIWVGGDRAAFDRARPVIDAVGQRISFMGGIGTGTISKLVHNTAANIRTATLAEVLTLGVKGGIEPTALWSAVRDGSNGRSRTFDSLGGKILDGTFDEPAFRLRHARKDMGLALQLGEELGVPLDLTALVTRTLDDAMARGWEDRDSNVAVKIHQERAGLDIPRSTGPCWTASSPATEAVDAPRCLNVTCENAARFRPSRHCRCRLLVGVPLRNSKSGWEAERLLLEA